jgi:hypothetical protein
MCPATPSSKPRSAKMRNAAARCCFLYNRSSSKLSNLGYDRIFNIFPDTVFPRAPNFALTSDSPTRVVADGAIIAEIYSSDSRQRILNFEFYRC